MEQTINQDKIGSDMGNIHEQDWPMLKELRGTRFQIKNQQKSRILDNQDEKTMEDIGSLSAMEDKLVNVSTVVDEQNLKNITIPANMQAVQPLNTLAVAQPVEDSLPTWASSKSGKSKSFMTLLAVGLVNMYLSTINNLLNPLGFLVQNSKKLIMGLLQFIVPALMTYYLSTQLPTISEQLASQEIVMKIVYVAIFYFACLFLWISIQAVGVGLWNASRNFFNNVAKSAETN